ncbi:MAG: signal peptidase I [Candidatus Obscuribacterales bacterium]|nr:signal peptidase I [Steroidobacteraceae bacterium]
MRGLDFSLVLVVAMVVTGLLWLADVLLLRRQRIALAETYRTPVDAAAQLPVTIEYASSFFPIIVIVLVIRSFLIEPFRIPSDSMMPTLLDGDFIFVNKFTYGVRLPVVNTKILNINDPQRGDVVVFRLPSDPSTNYIKRLVGLPGDHVVVADNRIVVNGTAMPMENGGLYAGPGYEGAQLARERLGEKNHAVLIAPYAYPMDYEATVPAGHFFFMGDNRNNSQDSRFPQVGFVPEQNLVGRAERIWMHWQWLKMPAWGRIGQAIQ